MSVKDLSLLNDALRLGIIDMGLVRSRVIMEKHKYKVWQGKNGYYYTYILEGGKRKLVKKKNEEDLVAAIEGRSNYIFGEVFREWIDKKREWGELDDSTIIRYKTDFTRFIEGTDFDKLSVGSLTDYILEDFIKSAVKTHALSPKSYQNLKIILSGPLKYAKKRGYTLYSIGTFFKDFDLSMKAFKKDEGRELIFSSADRKKLYKYLESHASIENLALSLLVLTGLRIGELSSLKKEDNIEPCKLFIHRTETRFLKEDGVSVKGVKEEGKQGHNGIIFIPSKAQEIIDKAYEITKGAEFLFSKNGKRISSWSLTITLKNACEKAGVTYHSPHKMRKTYASLLLSSGVSEAIVKEQMRHKNIQTTRAYYYRAVDSEKDRKKVINRVISI